MSLWYTDFTLSSGTAKNTKASSSALLLLSWAEACSTAGPLTVWCQLRVQPADSLTAQLASLQYSTTGSPSIWTGSQTLNGRMALFLRICVGLIRGQNTCRQTAELSHRQISLFQQQTHVIQSNRRVDRKHSVQFLLGRFSSNDTPTV